jgi:ubiquitin-protein ligase
MVSSHLSMILDDPLMGTIAQHYLNNRAEHDQTAREWTKRYAM